MSKSQLRAVLNALPELRAQGVERVKVGADGSVEIELSDMQPQRPAQRHPATTPQPPRPQSAQTDWHTELDAAMSSGLPDSQNSDNLSESGTQPADGADTDADTDTRSPGQIRDDKLDFGST